MDEHSRRFNVIAFVVIAAVLALFSYTAVSSGHPWAITCYQCRACNLNCPLGYDVASYLTAATTDNPDLYMTAKNLQITLGEALKTDPKMTVEVNGSVMTSLEAAKTYSNDTVVNVMRLRAKDAAKFDPVEGACERSCPINLPITDVIRDLKKNGGFSGQT
jgi:predicted aldo/keto reductase-like oxidoreductase